jgi:hypothetical protein
VPDLMHGMQWMSQFRFDLASPEDDAALRRVLAETPMEGEIAVSFRREPSFFAAAAVHGPFHQTIICRDNVSGQIVGFGCRSVRDLFVNGVPEPVGYLSALRVLPQYRNLGLIARGYARFRDLHGDGITRLYLTTIAEGNDRAVAILTSGRAGLPLYHFAGKYVTAAIPIPRVNAQQAATCEIRSTTVGDIPDLLAFWNSEGPRRQFFPRYSRDDFFSATGPFPHLQPEDILMAVRGGRIVGTLSTWDQRRFRQTVVERYSWPMRCMRPLYDAFARFRGVPPLPDVGRPFSYITAAHPVVAGDDLTVFTSLLRHALGRLSERLVGHLLVGLHEHDPLLAAISQFRPTKYLSRLYQVCWPDGDALRGRLDGRTPYLELGTL